jgi:hypothetical protein
MTIVLKLDKDTVPTRDTRLILAGGVLSLPPLGKFNVLIICILLFFFKRSVHGSGEILEV